MILCDKGSELAGARAAIEPYRTKQGEMVHHSVTGQPVLMVENEAFDTDAHSTLDREAVVAEMLSFDAAIAVGLDYHSRNPQTLIVVTSTHDSGGIHLEGDENRNLVMQYGSDADTGVRVPIFAIGPGAERFGELIDNDEVGQALLDLVRGEER